MYIVTVTSQGQISIPIKFRRELNIDQKKVMITKEYGRIIIEPAEDLLDLAGSFKTDKKISFKKIRAGFEDYLAKEAVSGI